MRRSTIAFLVLAVIAAPASGQPVTGPARGSWGGEFCFRCGVNVMRFRSPSSAWLLGIDAGYSKDHSESTSPFAGTVTEDQSVGFAALRVGIRSYRRSASPVRPYASLAVTASIQQAFSTHDYGYGVFGDAGAAYFFSPHLSLGLAATLNADIRTITDKEEGFESKERVTSVIFHAANLLASFYF